MVENDITKNLEGEDKPVNGELNVMGFPHTTKSELLKDAIWIREHERLQYITAVNQYYRKKYNNP